MRRFVQHQRARLRRKFSEAAPARRGARRKESLEEKRSQAAPMRHSAAIAAFGRAPARPDTGLDRRRDEQVARVAHERRAGVRNQRDALAAAQAVR
jgi:hypothetical protein